MTNKPIEISLPEWREIMNMRCVKEGWGLEGDETPEFFASTVYGAKFRYVNGSPGYQGDLFIIQGDALTPPFVFIRSNGALIKVIGVVGTPALVA